MVPPAAVRDRPGLRPGSERALARGDPIVILGPTAAGKSELALQVARRLGGRIISADSVQVYRGLDAGSSKPDPQARCQVPHVLIDVADPWEAFSAGRFARMAAAAMAACRRAGVVPIVAGGTGLYLRALLQGLAPLPPRDQDLRRALYARARATSAVELHEELKGLDPEAAGRIGRHDLQRIVRALEVVALTGVPLSRHQRERGFRHGALPALKIGLTRDRASLYHRVNERVERIFEAGIVQEVRALLAAGVPAEAHALKALGYREVVAHLRGAQDLARTMELVKRNTRRYARRQILWFRREQNVVWFNVDREAGGVNAIAGKVAEIYRISAVGN